jgi:hypothetical protein
MEHPDLVHLLPCVWNRQLCTWWRDHGYRDVFDAFAYCNGAVKLYHGNCNTPIPNDWQWLHSFHIAIILASEIQNCQLAAYSKLLYGFYGTSQFFSSKCLTLSLPSCLRTTWLKWQSCLVINAVACKTHSTFPKSPSDKNCKHFMRQPVFFIQTSVHCTRCLLFT